MLKENLRGINSYVFGFVILLCMLSITVLFIHGELWFRMKVLPLLNLLSLTAFSALILILLPLSIFSKTRSVSGSIMVFISFIFGIHLWFYGLLLTYILLGKLVAAAGLFLMGIGVIPLAMIAAPFNGMWLEFGSLIFLIILTLGVRSFGYYLVEISYYRHLF